MKILIIIPTLDTGGAQRAVSNLLMGLPDDVEADVVLNDVKSVVYPYKGNLIDLGMSNQVDRSSLLYQIKVFFRRLNKIKGLKKTRGYKAAYSFMDSANIANILTGNKYCKTIVSVRTNLAISARNNWKYRYLVVPIARLLYRYADKVVAVSKGVQDEMTDVMHFRTDTITTIYNGYDLENISRLGNDEVENDIKKLLNGNVITTMGRLSRAKAQWNLIRAMKIVVETIPDVRLLVLGDGERSEYLHKLVEELGLSRNVFFVGFKKNPFSIIKRSQLFVMTSLYEGFPNSLIEALALKVPCVATDFKSGAREILAPDLEKEKVVREITKAKYGIVTPICDGCEYSAIDPLTVEERILADAIIEMLGNHELRDYYIDRSNEVVEAFSIKKMVDSYCRLADC